MKVVVELSKEEMESYKNLMCIGLGNSAMRKIINGTPLPKGHGDLFDKTEILRFLKCPKYENCDWQNCFDCNESRCINLNNVDDLVPIIKADEEGEEDGNKRNQETDCH